MIFEKIRDFLFAPKALCMGCGNVMGANKSPFCTDCEKLLEPLYLNERYRNFRCVKCGEILDGKFCSRCRTRLPGGVYAYAPHAYTFPVSQLVQNFKFRSVYSLSEWMAGEIDFCIRKSGEEFDMIVPVPIHFTRRLTRGFNQSEKLARALSVRMAVPFENALKRTRYTPKQTTAKIEQRIAGLQNAFKADASVFGKRILLTDDVITTGTTLIRSRDALMKAGAASVTLCAFAISLPNPKSDKIT